MSSSSPPKSHRHPGCRWVSQSSVLIARRDLLLSSCVLFHRFEAQLNAMGLALNKDVS